MSGHHPSSIEIEGINLSLKTEEKCSSASCWIKSELRLAFRASTFLSHSLFFNLPNGDSNLITKDLEMIRIGHNLEFMRTCWYQEKEMRGYLRQSFLAGSLFFGQVGGLQSPEKVGLFLFIYALICSFIHPSNCYLFTLLADALVL